MNIKASIVPINFLMRALESMPRALILAICMSSLYNTTVIAPTTLLQFIDGWGCVQGDVAAAINALGVNLADHASGERAVPSNHIFNAYNFLKLFKNTDYDFYRKGAVPLHKLTIDQAKAILRIMRGCYATFKTEDPVEKKKADVIIFTGEDWSMEKRMHSFKAFLDAGYQCDKVFFLSRNQKLLECAQRAAARYAQCLEGMQTFYTQEAYDHVTHANFIAQIKSSISKEFYLISDPEYALTLKETCMAYGAQNGLKCLGVFTRSIVTDPDTYIEQDLKGYKFDEFIIDANAQLLAAAYSALNRFSHMVAQEIKLFDPEYRT